MFWLIVFVMFLGAGVIPNPIGGFLGVCVLGCLFYKVCEFFTNANETAHAALDRRDQRLYEEEQIRKAQLEQLNAQKRK